MRDSMRSSVQAVERAVDLLMALATAREPPTVRDLAQRLGCSPSTVQRLLRALERKGLVERDPLSRRLGLGVRALVLATGRSRQLDLHARALPHLRALRDLTGETVTLHVLAGEQHVCVVEVEGVHEVRRRVELGRVFPVERGSTGKVFRAWGAVVLPEPPGVVGGPDGLPRTLEQVRQAGYAVSIEERERGVSGMSAPIFDAQGQVWAAVTVSGPSDRFGPEQMRAAAGALLATALGISRELGYMGAGEDGLGMGRPEQAVRRSSR